MAVMKLLVFMTTWTVLLFARIRCAAEDHFESLPGGVVPLKSFPFANLLLHPCGDHPVNFHPLQPLSSQLLLPLPPVVLSDPAVVVVSNPLNHLQHSTAANVQWVRELRLDVQQAKQLVRLIYTQLEPSVRFHFIAALFSVFTWNWVLIELLMFLELGKGVRHNLVIRVSITEFSGTWCGMLLRPSSMFGFLFILIVCCLAWAVPKHSHHISIPPSDGPRCPRIDSSSAMSQRRPLSALHVPSVTSSSSVQYLSFTLLFSQMLLTFHRLAGKLESILCSVFHLESSRAEVIRMKAESLVNTTLLHRYVDCSSRWYSDKHTHGLYSLCRHSSIVMQECPSLPSNPSRNPNSRHHRQHRFNVLRLKPPESLFLGVNT